MGGRDGRRRRPHYRINLRPYTMFVLISIVSGGLVLV